MSLGDYLFKIEPPPGQAPDPQSGFCNELSIKIFSAADYLFGEHRLSLVNSDSQAADVLYPADGLIIAKVGTGDAPQAGDTAVTGKNFAAGTRYIWYDAASKPIGQLQNATNITETSLIVGARESANDRLVLVSPVGLRAREKA